MARKRFRRLTNAMMVRKLLQQISELNDETPLPPGAMDSYTFQEVKERNPPKRQVQIEVAECACNCNACSKCMLKQGCDPSPMAGEAPVAEDGDAPVAEDADASVAESTTAVKEGEPIEGKYKGRVYPHHLLEFLEALEGPGTNKLSRTHEFDRYLRTRNSREEDLYFRERHIYRVDEMFPGSRFLPSFRLDEKGDPMIVEPPGIDGLLEHSDAWSSPVEIVGLANDEIPVDDSRSSLVHSESSVCDSRSSTADSGLDVGELRADNSGSSLSGMSSGDGRGTMANVVMGDINSEGSVSGDSVLKSKAKLRVNMAQRPDADLTAKQLNARRRNRVRREKERNSVLLASA